MTKERWGSGLGFVLAAAGSAVGLGNLWGFAYRASQGGGGAFVLLYLVIVFLVCLPLLVAEMALGRSTRKSPLRAPAEIAGKSWGLLGWLFLVVSVGILSYYVVLMGYTGTTLLNALLGQLPVDKSAATDYFPSISTGSVSLIGQLLSIALTGIVVAAGVRGGIERLTRLGVPLLFFMLICLAIWAVFQPNAHEGYAFLFGWDAKQLLDPSTIANAFKQAFFSVGTGIGAILAYSAYLSRKSSIPGEALAVVTMDTAVGLLAGCVTFPLVAILGLGDLVGAGTVGTLFSTLPHGLALPSLGIAGKIVSVTFFSLVYIAAITSSISLLEVPVSSLIDNLGWNRNKAVLCSVALVALLGIPSAINVNFLVKVDSVMNTLLIASGLILSVLMGWVVPKRLRADLTEVSIGNSQVAGLLWTLRWISVPTISLGFCVVAEETFRNIFMQ
ncbi:sodium-dependent transporter [Prochlorococcus sp. MIT 1300]|uniref:sodium-dependent transporter n=1 Tax=Prochlorococcus sp. MIT 1300 TaxID=3096218 RepID=UPI002A75791A|nr:sodium-dependent transporter [Prochlorococcus sp. MIT 1300]